MKEAKSGEKYYGANCKKCKKLLLLPHDYNPKSSKTWIECNNDKCGHRDLYMRNEIRLYVISKVH